MSDQVVVELAAVTCEQYARGILPDAIIPGSDGSLALVWDQLGAYIYLDVGPKASLHLYYKSPFNKWAGVGSPSNPTMKQNLGIAFGTLRLKARSDRHCRDDR